MARTKTTKTATAATKVPVAKAAKAAVASIDKVAFFRLPTKTKLADFNRQAIETYQKGGDLVHVAILADIHHAAKYGQPALLNQVTAALRPNDLTAVRLFVRRHSIEVGLAMLQSPKTLTDILSPEEQKAALEAGSFLNFKNNQFEVRKGRVDQCHAWINLIETKLLNPDGKVYHRVLARNNIQVMREIGDLDVLDRLLSVAKSIEGDDTEKKTIRVSASIKKLVAKVKDMAETAKGQYSEA